MATLILTTCTPCAISLNGSFCGFLYNNKELTLPLPNGETVFCATPLNNDFQPTNCFIDVANGPRLMPCDAKLLKWNHDIYELRFEFKKAVLPPPPVILKEYRWAKGFIGLCGGYIVFEKPNGSRTYYDNLVDDLILFTEAVVLAKKDNFLIPLDINLNPLCHPLPCDNFKIEGNRLFVSFTPGDMDFFTVEQIFDANLNLVSSDIITGQCSCAFDHLRLFCQAVRLNISDVALGYLTPSLKEEMNFESIKDFLGFFDQTDKPRYLSAFNENTLALRYKIDESNFHYICYDFTFNTTTDTILIDDIHEV